MKQPNLVFVFADQWRRQAMGIMGQDPVITPHMDAFAQDALLFEHAVSCNPLCSPHRACLLTGQYSTTNGVFTNCKTGAPDVCLKEDVVCISDVLKAQGYQTAYLGKWHLDSPEENFCEIPASGARGWDAYTPPGPKRHGFDYWHSYGASNQHLNPFYWENNDKQIFFDEWSPTHEVRYALDYLKSRDENAPVCMFISWNPPHNPYELVPEQYRAQYDPSTLPHRQNVDLSKGGFRYHTDAEDNITYPMDTDGYHAVLADYYAAVTGLDDQFGRLINGLKEMGMYDDTIIVLSADHGDMMGAHGMLAKHCWHEESIGIPFVIRWGDNLKKGRESSMLNSVDVMPTLLELMGAPIPETVQGDSIATRLRGEIIDGIRYSLCVGIPGTAEMLKAFTAAGLSSQTAGWRAVCTPQYTYVVDRGYWPNGGTQRILYDLKADPYQLHPITTTTAEGIYLEKIMLMLLEKANDPFIFDQSFIEA